MPTQDYIDAFSLLLAVYGSGIALAVPLAVFFILKQAARWGALDIHSN